MFQAAIGQDIPLTEVVKIHELAHHRVRQSLVLYTIPTQPLVESAKVVQELPVYPLFRSNLAPKLLPYESRIDRFGAERAQLTGNLVEIGKYLKGAIAGITRDVAIIPESRVQSNPCRAHYQQKWNYVLVPDSAVYLASFTFGFGLANVDDWCIPLRRVVGRCVQYVRASQIALGLLGLSEHMAEVAVGFKALAGKEIGGAAVLKRVQNLVKIHC
jgi:hypothetical protein